jgi:4,5-DOPA dioxygenase extradiol
MIVGSGNIVHNLRLAVFQDRAYDWAIEFDETIEGLIQSDDHVSIVRYQELGKAASLSVPTNEHYLPLLYVLALQDRQEQVRFFAQGVTLGAISMRSLLIE